MTLSSCHANTVETLMSSTGLKQVPVWLKKTDGCLHFLQVQKTSIGSIHDKMRRIDYITKLKELKAYFF